VWLLNGIMKSGAAFAKPARTTNSEKRPTNNDLPTRLPTCYRYTVTHMAGEFRYRFQRRPRPWTAAEVAALRQRLGLSQAAFAEEIGVRQQTVSEWETGMYKPRGASVTILTLLAVSSGFKFDQPVSRSNGHEPAPRMETNGSAPRRQVTQPDPPPVRPLATHPDWIRTNGTSHRGVTPSPRNFVQPGNSGMAQRGPEIPM
jgi:DNA-binding transcriptional regulator YiaG